VFLFFTWLLLFTFKDLSGVSKICSKLMLSFILLELIEFRTYKFVVPFAKNFNTLFSIIWLRMIDCSLLFLGRSGRKDKHFMHRACGICLHISLLLSLLLGNLIFLYVWDRLGRSIALRFVFPPFICGFYLSKRTKLGFFENYSNTWAILWKTFLNYLYSDLFEKCSS